MIYSDPLLNSSLLRGGTYRGGISQCCLGYCVLTGPRVLRISQKGATVGSVMTSPRQEVKGMRRRPVSKGRSARSFRKKVGRTKGANLSRPTRGGIRM